MYIGRWVLDLRAVMSTFNCNCVYGSTIDFVECFDALIFLVHSALYRLLQL